MILEYRTRMPTPAPLVTFHYISPQLGVKGKGTGEPVGKVGARRRQVVSYVPIEEEARSQGKRSQRKKIFDRTYTCKSTLQRQYSRETSIQPKQRMPQKQPNKQRKAIFPKRNKNINFSHYPFRNYSPGHSQVRHSPSVQRFMPKLQTQREIYRPFHPELPTAQPSNPSVIKVQLSDSATDRSVNNSVFELPNHTDSRFFDKDPPTQRNKEKLSEVNLYATTANGNFLAKAEPQKFSIFHSLYQSMSKQSQSSLLPFLLVLLGFSILLLQVAS